MTALRIALHGRKSVSATSATPWIDTHEMSRAHDMRDVVPALPGCSLAGSMQKEGADAE